MGDAGGVGPRPGILVVEDEEEIRENIVELLSLEDYRVLSASNAAKALQLLESEKVDVLLTDYLMPGANGLELIEAVWRMDGDISAILMTAHLHVYERLDEELKRRIILLVKPFDAHEALDLVKQELRRRRPRDA